jgi:hypothetical protein
MDPQHINLSIVVRTPPLQVVPIGPGRLLTQAYLSSGRFVGKKVNRLAHRLGHGPDAATERIEKELRIQRIGLMWSPHHACEVSDELRRDCLKLMKYAQP